MCMSASFRTQLRGLVESEDAKSLLFQFKDTQIAELTKALEAPICEFVCLLLRVFFFFDRLN
jgi:hypothetical protein